jgi:4-amino-4-deoxy-L-arabinose transferase-like glycosyltransferase
MRIGMGHRVALGAIASVAFLIRLLHVFSYQSIPTNDMAAFVWTATKSLTVGNLFSAAGVSRYPPGYPLFLKPFYAVLAPEIAHRAVQVAQAALGALTCILIYRLARRLHSRRAGLLAALFTCFFPHFLFYSSHLMTENLFIPAYYGCLLLWLRVAGKPTGPRLYGAGLATAAAVLIRPVAVSLAPAILWAIWPAGRYEGGGEPGMAPAVARRRLRALLLVAAGGLTLILPWSVHNWLASGHLYLVAPYGSYLLAIGNAPDSSGTTRPLDPVPGNFWDQHDQQLADVSQFITEDPWGALSVTLKLKWRNFWTFVSPWPMTVLNTRLMLGDHFFPFVSWRVILVLGIMGILLTRRPRVGWIAVACAVAYMGFYMVFYGKPRYRMPMEGYFLAWSGIAAAVVLLSIPYLRRVKPRVWSGGIVILLGLVLVETGVDGALSRWQFRTLDALLDAGADVEVDPKQSLVTLLGDEPVPIDRARGRYLRLDFEAHRSGSWRMTPDNGSIRIVFMDQDGKRGTWNETPGYSLAALPEGRPVPMTIKAQIPPWARSCRVELMPTPGSPDRLVIRRPVLRYARGNDIAGEFLVPYLTKFE